jgi:hypothetical protein
MPAFLGTQVYACFKLCGQDARVPRVIPKPVWAVGFALEQTLRDAALAVFSFADFKTASAYLYL